MLSDDVHESVSFRDGLTAWPDSLQGHRSSPSASAGNRSRTRVPTHQPLAACAGAGQLANQPNRDMLLMYLVVNAVERGAILCVPAGSPAIRVAQRVLKKLT